MLQERKVGLLRCFAVLEAYIGGGIVDPLNIYFTCRQLVGDEMVMGKCDDVAGMEFIDTSDMDFVPLGFEAGIFSVDGGY